MDGVLPSIWTVKYAQCPSTRIREEDAMAAKKKLATLQVRRNPREMWVYPIDMLVGFST